MFCRGRSPGWHRRVHVGMCMRVKIGNQERKRKEEEKWGETGAEIERLQIKRELDQERVT